jgi:translocation and assembly module TamB
MAEAKRRIPFWIRAAVSVAGAAIVLALVGVGLRYWITSDGGRAFIVSQIDGRKIGPLGVIRISGLKGDPLKAATLADIALVDDDGVWLRARDAKIAWTPFKLFAGNLEIAAVDVRDIDVQRRPHTTEKSRNNGAPDIGLKLDALTIHELKLADGVLGPAASFSIDGAGARDRDGSGFGRLTIVPLAGPGDRLQANAEWSARGALTGQVNANGPAGGAFATLLLAPDDATVALDAHLSGTLAEFTGDARLSFSGTPIVTIDVGRKGDAAKLDAMLAAGRWMLLDPVANYSGGAINVSATAQLGDLKRTPVSVTLSAPVGQIAANTIVNIDDSKLVGPLQLNSSNLDLARFADGIGGRLDATGIAKIDSLTGWSWQGDAVVDDLAFPGGAAKKAAGPITAGMSGNAVTWEGARIAVEGGRISSLKDLRPATYTVATRGEYNLRTHVVDIHQAEVAGQPGAVSARGTYNVKSDAMEFNGGAMLARLADVSPLTGSARAQWTVKRAGGKTPIRVTVGAAGRNVGSSVSALAQLLGEAPEIDLTGVVANDNFVVESGAVSGSALEAKMTGRVGDNGQIDGRATGRIRRPVDLGGATLRSLNFSAALSGKTAEPHVDLQLADGGLAVAGMTLKDVSGNAQASLGKTIAGRFSLKGDADGQPLTVAGTIGGGDGAYRLADVSARLAGLTLTAPQLAYDHGDLAASFRASGSLAGIEGVTRGTLGAQGQLTLKDDRLQFAASGQASGIRRGEIRIQQATFDASAANDKAKLSGHVTGRAGARFDLGFKASAAQVAHVWTGDATLDGKIDNQPVATVEPVKWTYGSSGWSVDAALSALGGRLDAKAASAGENASSSFTLADIDLLALTRLARTSPISGRISGASSFANTKGVATANLDIHVVGANPSGVTADPVTAAIRGQLRDGRLQTTVDASGQGFRLNAAAILPIEAGAGFNVAPARDKPIQANLSLSGRAEQLWALFGPEDQSLRGKIDAEVKVAGTLATPTLNGGFNVADGVYEHGETGFRLSDIAAKGVFDQTSAHITELTANDGGSGRFTAKGEINWEKTLTGGVRFTATDLKALGRDDRSATVSGDGAVTLQPDAVLVSGDLHIAQARISIEQPASATIPTLPIVRRVNFRGRDEDEDEDAAAEPKRPVRLDLQVSAPRRVVVFGRGLDTEWSADFHVTGSTDDPSIDGTATLVRGTLDLAGRRFDFDSGSVRLNGPIREARVDISASRNATDVDASVHVTGSPVKPEFTLQSTPALPQDEILARVIFGKSASQLSALEAAQLAAGLAQLAGGQAAFDPSGLIRKATGLDRVALGATDGAASVSAGKYITDDVYLQVGAGGTGGVGAQVEWEPKPNLSVTSGAQANGDTRIAVRWKKDY